MVGSKFQKLKLLSGRVQVLVIEELHYYLVGSRLPSVWKVILISGQVQASWYLLEIVKVLLMTLLGIRGCGHMMCNSLKGKLKLGSVELSRGGQTQLGKI